MNIENFIIETFCFIDDELKKITSQVKLRSCGCKLVETVIGQLSERFNIEQNWARDIWHLTNRMARKILSHTFSVFLCIKYGRSPLDLDGLVTA